MDCYGSAIRLHGIGEEAFFLGDRQPMIPVRFCGTGACGQGLGVEATPKGPVLIAGGPHTLLCLHADIPVTVRSGCARTLILCELFINGEACGCDGGVTALGELRFFHVTSFAPIEQPVNEVECSIRFCGDIGSVTGVIPREHASLCLARFCRGIADSGTVTEG